MKTLAIIAVILAVLSLYFIVNADRSILVKGSEILPAGTDIARFILNKAKDFSSQIKTGSISKSSSVNISDTSYPAITDKIKTAIETIKSGANNLIPKVFDKASESIRETIKNKISETFCPIK